MSYKVEALPNAYAELGEGPHWDIERQSLYFVDIDAGKVLRYDYQQNKTYSAKIEGESLASFIIPVEGTTDQFAIGCGRRVVIISWDGVAKTARAVRTLYEVERQVEHLKENRINDGKCDPRGRLFAGTMYHAEKAFTDRRGTFYKFEKNGQVSVVKSDIAISNGLTWNEKAGKFYYIDTADHEVKEYDYDMEKGVASNPRVLYDLRKSDPKDHLMPDGMTIDSEGYLYVATFNNHSVHKVDPKTGKLLLRIELPCKQITSVAFGGPKLDELFVTTSSLFNEPAPAGTTYKVTGLGVKGLPMAKLRI